MIAPGHRRVAHGVLDEVRDDLVDALGVARRDRVVLGLDAQLDALGHVQPRLARGLLEQVADAERPAVERLGLGLQAREVEQLGDEAAEALDLGEHRRDGLRVGGLDAVGDVLELGLQRGDRRAQLVRDVGDEVAALAVDLLELGGHRVERARELADLVAPVLAHPHARSRRGAAPGWPGPSRAAAG